MTLRDAMREWWFNVARMGMVPSEMHDSLIATLDAAGFKIVRKDDTEQTLNRVKQIKA